MNVSSKEQLYYLLKHFKTGKYGTESFCNLFTIVFDIDIDKSTLSETELTVFGELEKYTCRFSPLREDIEKYPGTYFDENIIKEKTDWAIKELQIII